MTFSTHVQRELFTSETDQNSDEMTSQAIPKLIRLPLTRPFGARNNMSMTKNQQSTSVQAVGSSVVETHNKSPRHGQGWTTEEHDRFLQALEIFPSGPWKDVAAFIGTRTPRQAMTHAQKYREKIRRRRRGPLNTFLRPEIYRELTVETSPSGKSTNTAEKSPTAVDWHPVHLEDPQQRNWLDNLSVEDMDAAFQAVLEHDDVALSPLDIDELIRSAFTTDGE
ncbi:Myb-like protein J [Phytophthora citrophthora]|uniref:Myb-like protein J n=1 Tax=Phytophthora citrophthora TaxID=4793 RepID=A0AAD9LPQ8_9STRA|nr:Myb-like protein J [Phytophthora citrophthora]